MTFDHQALPVEIGRQQSRRRHLLYRFVVQMRGGGGREQKEESKGDTTTLFFFFFFGVPASFVWTAQPPTTRSWPNVGAWAHCLANPLIIPEISRRPSGRQRSQFGFADTVKPFFLHSFRISLLLDCVFRERRQSPCHRHLLLRTKSTTGCLPALAPANRCLRLVNCCAERPS